MLSRNDTICTMTYVAVTLLFLKVVEAQTECATDGSDASYQETFLGTLHHVYDSRYALHRYIRANGCPNHPTNALNPNQGLIQNFTYSIPAYPYFNGESYQDALDNNYADISQTTGEIAITLNGVAVYTAYAGNYDYDGNGTIDSGDVDYYGFTSNAVTAEGDTFDSCGGHSSGENAGYQYHYHIPPTCLLAQMGYNSSQHSRQVGWMLDGFPLYGPRGPEGTRMMRCGQVGAHETYCLDKCNGYYSDDGSIDVYKYRYYITGQLSDQTQDPADPLPTSSPANASFFPFTPYCAVGCTSQGSRQWEGSRGSYLDICDTSVALEQGYIFAHELANDTDATAGGLQDGVVAEYIPGTNAADDDDDEGATSTYDRAPNVLIFQPDDLYQVYGTSWYVPEDPGYHFDYVTPVDSTSNIDRIASEGAAFTRAYTASAMCSPSRIALLTGRYASRGSYAVFREDNVGSQTHVTVPKSKMYGADLTYNLPSALKSLEYTTGAFGKWHLSSDMDYADDYADLQQDVRDAGFDVAEAIYIDNLNTCGDTCANFSHNTEWVTYETMSFMKNAIDSNSSFFAYVNPTPPHGGDTTYSLRALAADDYGPYYCEDSAAGLLDAPWTTECRSDHDFGPDFSDVCATCVFASRDNIWAVGRDAATGSSNRSTVAGVAWVDQSMGSLYAFLEENGVLDDTIIIILSDNGYAKATLYEWGVRTLMHVRYPNGGISAGSVVSEPVSNVDLVPSIFALIGASGSYDTNGMSWKDVATGEASKLERDTLVFEIAYDVSILNTSTNRKLIWQNNITSKTNELAQTSVTNAYDWWAKSEYQLYDLTTDENEQNDVYESATDAATLLNALNDHIVTWGSGTKCCSPDEMDLAFDASEATTSTTLAATTTTSESVSTSTEESTSTTNDVTTSTTETVSTTSTTEEVETTTTTEQATTSTTLAATTTTSESVSTSTEESTSTSDEATISTTETATTEVVIETTYVSGSLAMELESIDCANDPMLQAIGNIFSEALRSVLNLPTSYNLITVSITCINERRALAYIPRRHLSDSERVMWNYEVVTGSSTTSEIDLVSELTAIADTNSSISIAFVDTLVTYANEDDDIPNQSGDAIRSASIVSEVSSTSSTSTSSSSESTTTVLIIGAIAGVAGFALIAALIAYFFCAKRTSSSSSDVNGRLRDVSEESLDSAPSTFGEHHGTLIAHSL